MAFCQAERARLRAVLTALGRIGDPDVFGLLIASLLSDDSRCVDARRIEVSG